MTRNHLFRAAEPTSSSRNCDRRTGWSLASNLAKASIGRHAFQGFIVTGGHWIEPTSTGSRVTVSIRLEGLLSPIVSWFARKLNASYLDLEARGLKAYCEARTLMTRLGVRLVLVLAIAATISCDRATKHLAATTLAGAPAQSFLADTVRIQYAENAGGFLSMGSDLPPLLRTGLFTFGTGLALLGLIAAAVIFRWTGWPLLGVSLYVAGGASNWIDRLAHGTSSTSSTSVSVRSAREYSMSPTLPSCLAWRLSWSRKWHAHAGSRRLSPPNSHSLRRRALCVMGALVAWTAATVACAGKHPPAAEANDPPRRVISSTAPSPSIACDSRANAPGAQKAAAPSTDNTRR